MSIAHRRISAIALAALLGACAGPVAEPASVAPPPRAETPRAPSPPAAPSSSAKPAEPLTFVPATRPLLADGYRDRFRERALPKAKWHDASERTVVATDADRARIVVELPNLRVLSWVALSDLHETPLEIVRLSAAAEQEPAASGPGATIAPGTRIERRGEKAGWAKVVAHGALEVHGWLPAQSIGRVFVPAAIPGGGGADDWELKPSSKILWKPGGRTLAVFPREPRVGQLGVTQVGAIGWYIEIQHASRDIDVRGFVAKQHLKPFLLRGYGRGSAYSSRAVAPSEELAFERGTCLYDRPNGEVIGVVIKKHQLLVHIETGELAAWRALDFGAGVKAWAPRRFGVGAELPAQSGGEPLPIPLESWTCATLDDPASSP